MADKMLVRLKPYDPKRRHVMQSYTHAPSALRFEAARGWYRVDASIAAYLKTVPQLENDPDSPMAFDVVTEDQGKQLDERETRSKEQRASASNPTDLDHTPHDLTTADLHQHGHRGPTEPQTRADAPTAGLRRDGAVEPGKPPHYAADDPKGYRKLIHREDLPDITSAVPGPPPVTGALPGGSKKATADEPNEPTPAPPVLPYGAPPFGAPGAPASGSYGNYPPPGYGDPESLKTHIEKVDATMKEEARTNVRQPQSAQSDTQVQPRHATSQRPPAPTKDEK